MIISGHLPGKAQEVIHKSKESYYYPHKTNGPKNQGQQIAPGGTIFIIDLPEMAQQQSRQGTGE